MKKEATNKNEQCVSCGEDTAIRNPTGKCDHLYYPENINKNEQADIAEFKKELLYKMSPRMSGATNDILDSLDDLHKKQEARIRKEYKERALEFVKDLKMTPYPKGMPMKDEQGYHNGFTEAQVRIIKQLRNPRTIQ